MTRRAAHRRTTGRPSSSTAPRRFPSATFPAPLGPRLRSALAARHHQHPFSPRDVREAAHRVVDAAHELELDAVIVRGGLDVGGAELDHVWAVVDGRVVDVTMPLRSEAFIEALRAYVAGDRSSDDLDRIAHGYDLAWRVVGDFPASLRYVGQPIWSTRAG